MPPPTPATAKSDDLLSPPCFCLRKPPRQRRALLRASPRRQRRAPIFARTAERKKYAGARANANHRAGCFNRCAKGPVIAVYPDAVWYRYDNDSDLKEIADSHLINGNPVERLRLKD